MSGVTPRHSESDVEPECRVVFAGGRLNESDLVDSRRIEISFDQCRYARLGPHGDTQSIEAIGYRIEPSDGGDVRTYLKWWIHEWKSRGYCPRSGFYVAKQSA